MEYYNTFDEWLHSLEGKIIRYWVLKEVWTPYETRNAFMDESIYEDTSGRPAFLESAVSLGDGDFLLGLRGADSETLCPHEWVDYFRLSKIRISKYDDDQYGEVEHEEK